MACIMMGLQAQSSKDWENSHFPWGNKHHNASPFGQVAKSQEIHACESLYLWRPSSSKFQWDQSVSDHRTLAEGSSGLWQLHTPAASVETGKVTPHFSYNVPGQLWNPTWRERNFILTPFGNEHEGQPGLQRKCQRGGSSEKMQQFRQWNNILWVPSRPYCRLLQQFFKTRTSPLPRSLLQKWLFLP